MYSNDHSIAYNARDPADPHHLNPMNAVRITFALLYLGRTEQARSHEKVQQTQFRVLPPDVWAAKFQMLSNLEECI